MVEKVYIDKCSDDMCIPNKYHGLAVSVSVSHESASDVLFLQNWATVSFPGSGRLNKNTQTQPSFSHYHRHPQSPHTHTQVQVHTVLVLDTIYIYIYTSIV